MRLARLPKAGHRFTGSLAISIGCTLLIAAAIKLLFLAASQHTNWIRKQISTILLKLCAILLVHHSVFTQHLPVSVLCLLTLQTVTLYNTYQGDAGAVSIGALRLANRG
jgi:hypothetical protein